jgi:hypothetical protein
MGGGCRDFSGRPIAQVGAGATLLLLLLPLCCCCFPSHTVLPALALFSTHLVAGNEPRICSPLLRPLARLPAVQASQQRHCPV